MSFSSVPASEAAAFRDSTKHIVVLALENRSFDHVLGFLHKRGDNLANIQVRLPPGADAEAAKTKYPLLRSRLPTRVCGRRACSSREPNSNPDCARISCVPLLCLPGR